METNVVSNASSIRHEIAKLVNEFALLSKSSHQEVWNSLYDHAKYVLHKDYRLLSKNEGRPAIQIVEEDGRLSELLEISKKLLNPSNLMSKDEFLNSLEAMKSGG
ncbi:MULTISPECIES: hypothetical protein [Leptospira]|uniref:hypothetical protein n=1 Tax=Leptospira TaxID=171 RepID=UPI00109152EE|nr:MULTISPECIES: hypothetical protein [Leptospira]TGL97959.1 hypothetical protein EHQ79_19115 [Leptospira jelokensis]TGM88269.1 hypothetical protein EHQ99_00190 [Leptospira bouyouniensis]